MKPKAVQEAVEEEEQNEKLFEAAREKALSKEAANEKIRLNKRRVRELHQFAREKCPTLKQQKIEVRLPDGEIHSSGDESCEEYKRKTERMLLNDTITRVLCRVKEHPDAWLFLEPVDETEVPDYYTVIKKPMCLNLMVQQSDRDEYESRDQLEADISLMFTNCQKYNGTDSEVYKMSLRLRKHMEKILETAFYNPRAATSGRGTPTSRGFAAVRGRGRKSLASCADDITVRNRLTALHRASLIGIQSASNGYSSDRSSTASPLPRSKEHEQLVCRASLSTSPLSPGSSPVAASGLLFVEEPNYHLVSKHTLIPTALTCSIGTEFVDETDALSLQRDLKPPRLSRAPRAADDLWKPVKIKENMPQLSPQLKFKNSPRSCDETPALSPIKLQQPPTPRISDSGEDSDAPVLDAERARSPSSSLSSPVHRPPSLDGSVDFLDSPTVSADGISEDNRSIASDETNVQSGTGEESVYSGAPTSPQAGSFRSSSPTDENGSVRSSPSSPLDLEQSAASLSPSSVRSAAYSNLSVSSDDTDPQAGSRASSPVGSDITDPASDSDNTDAAGE